MKKRLVALLMGLSSSNAAYAAPTDSALNGALYAGVNLGELPWGGSFKPGIALGYYVNELVYVGVVYQVPDTIRRDGSSFNASGLGKDGIVKSEESVGQRFMLHSRVRPHRYAPFLSFGMVFNDEDREETLFDDETRVVQTREAGLRPAIGLGYDYTFSNGLTLNVEWTGWLFDIPKPKVEIDGGPLTDSERSALEARAEDNFESNITNAYHLFALGVGYAF
ncbi:MAG: hypothetical protein KC766_03295 [Myxococcales bacterium]|nr:hypothetical protein [Myxococcales bacterium]